MMAEIRCPMCGKSNPDHLDVCEFCQARLKPLGSIPSDTPSIFPEDLEADDELPDWMEFDADFGDSEDSTLFDDSGDDWMSRIGGKSESEEPSSSQDESGLMAESRAAARMDFDNNGIPDWMEDLERDRATPPLEPKDESPGNKIPDFLLSGQDTEIPEEAAEADEDDLMDWFLGGSDEKEESTAPATQGGLPDWLVSSEETEPSKPEGIDSLEAELPDFFAESDEDSLEPTRPLAESELPESSTEYVAQETIPLADFEGDLPDWLADASRDESNLPEAAAEPSFDADDQDSDLPTWHLGDEGEAESMPEAGVPDWLSELDGAELAPEETAASAEEGDTELPDWLSGLGEQKDTPVSAVPEEPEAMDTDDLAGMLAANAAESESLEPSSESDLPDWLSREEEPEPAQPAVESDLPPWLTDLSGLEEEPAEEPKAPKPFDMDTGDLEGMLAGEAAENLESATESDLPD